MKRLLFFLTCFLCYSFGFAQKNKAFDVASPNGNVKLHIAIANTIEWSVRLKDVSVIEPSSISLQLQNETLGTNAVVTSSKAESVNQNIAAINYIKATIPDHYNQITLRCKGDWGLVFRVYDDAVAYRFFTGKKNGIIVKGEEAAFNFTNDDSAFVPIQWDYRDGKIFNSSFEALYHHIPLSQFPKDSFGFSSSFG